MHAVKNKVVKPVLPVRVDDVESVDYQVRKSHLTKPKSPSQRATNFVVTTDLDCVPEFGNNRLKIINKLSNLYPKSSASKCGMIIHDDTNHKHLMIGQHFLKPRTLDQVSAELGIDKQYIWIWRGYASNMFSYLCHLTDSARAFKKRFTLDRLWANFDIKDEINESEKHTEAHLTPILRAIRKFTAGKITEVELFEKIGILAYDKYYYRIARAKRDLQRGLHLDFLNRMQNKKTRTVLMDNVHDDFSEDPNYDNLVSQHMCDDGDTFDTVKEELAIKITKINNRRAFRVYPEFGYMHNYQGEELLIIDCKKLAKAPYSKLRANVIQIIKDSIFKPYEHDLETYAHRHLVPLNCEAIVLINFGCIADEIGFDMSMSHVMKLAYDPASAFNYYGFKDDYSNLDTRLDTRIALTHKKGNKKRFSKTVNS